jgi:hypothetical protein
MNKLRELINSKPWVGWAVAGVLALVGAFFAFRGLGTAPGSTESYREMVTIKFTDTEETIEMPRGRFLRELMLRPGKADPSVGINNPATGKPTGFLFDKAEWERTIADINKEKEAAAKGPAVGAGDKGKPTPPSR